MTRLTDDIRLAWRRLRSKPATVVTAIGMLALGVGITTTMFTLVDALILTPVPFRDADRLAAVAMFDDHGGSNAVPVPVFDAWRDAGVFEAVNGASQKPATIDTPSGPATEAGALVTPGLFEMLGVQPIRGRTFAPGEGRAGTDDVVIVSEGFWRDRLAADPDIIGRVLDLDGERVRVVGVMPGSFRFPYSRSVIWRPIDYDAPPAAVADLKPVAYARFATGVPEADALRQATTIARDVDATMTTRRATPMALARGSFDVYSSNAVPVLAGGVAMVFLGLCANVFSLLLARLGARRRELGVSSALGASRGRLVRQAAIEHLMIGAAAAVAGLGMGWLLVAWARGYVPAWMTAQSLNTVDLDLRALAIVASAGMMAALLAGFPPAWLGTRVTPGDALRADLRTGTDSRATRATTRMLLAGEIAFACALLVGAAVLVESFVNLTRADRGLDTRNVVAAQLSLPERAFPDRASRVAFADAVEQGVGALPGVTQLAISYGLPPDGAAIHFSPFVSDVPGAEPVRQMLNSYTVGGDFFDLFGIPLRQGRFFDAGDPPDSVVVGERLARLLWPEGGAVGHTFHFAGETAQYHVVGVVGELTTPTLDPQQDLPEFYRPLTTRGLSYMNLSLRCAGRCPDREALIATIHAASPRVVIGQLGPLDDAYLDQLERPRAAAVLTGAFAVIALFASAGGLFSVLSYAVGRRRREFGIRAALGARPGEIRGLVFRDGAVVVVTGLAAGAIAAALLARVLRGLAFGVTAASPIIWIVVPGAIALAAGLAAWRPARQAARVDPVTLLRDA
ncbi:MAG: ABC transporter permease [Vicinamibacterales bacterium]